jgi:hypothetical protein
MTSLENAGERQVTVLTHEAADVGGVGLDLCVASLLERGGDFGRYGCADGFAA